MTNLCMTLQIGATFDHPLVDLKKKKGISHCKK